jgi:hypothetical protein
MNASTGRVSGAPFKDRARLGEDDVLYVPVSVATGGTLDAVWYPGTNDDSSPVEGDTVTLVRIGGFYAATGGKGAEPEAEPGERELFSRNADRDKVARVFLKADGEIDVESLVTEGEGEDKETKAVNRIRLLNNGDVQIESISDDEAVNLIKLLNSGEVVIESVKGESSITLTTDGDMLLNSKKSKLALRANGKYYLGNGGDDMLAAILGLIGHVKGMKTVGAPTQHVVSPGDIANLTADEQKFKSFMDSEG